MTRIQVTYQQNPEYEEDDGKRPRLFAAIDLSRYGVEERITELPVYFRHLARPIGPLRQIYSASIAGLPLEKGNLNSLEKSLDIYLGALIHFGRLPEYFFCLEDRAWPIYRLPDQLVTRYPGSPVMGAETIGELRLALADYFKLMGHIQNRKELSIVYLSRTDLQLVQPVCVLRAPGLADVPVFPQRNGRGNTLVAPVNATSVTVSLEGSAGFVKLHREVSAYLMEKGKLDQPSDLTIRKLSAPMWADLRATLKELDKALSYYRKVDGRMVRQQAPVYANGQSLVTARTNHLERTALHFAPTIWDLQTALGQELYAEGKLTSPNQVTVRRAE